MSQLYKRLLIFAVIVVSLTWIPQNLDAQEGTQGGCTTKYNSDSGGGLDCDGLGNGYSQACADLERGNRDYCIANGSSGSTYQTCMSIFNDPAYCCDQQINADIQANCQCVIDPRNPDCVCNP